MLRAWHDEIVLLCEAEEAAVGHRHGARVGILGSVVVAVAVVTAKVSQSLQVLERIKYIH